MTYELDTCGLLCPLPVLKARKRLSSLASGDILALLCDDPAAAIDVPHFCNENGHELTKTVDEGQGKTLYLIKKA
ncbi:sulfurtransferase TusA family protein [Rhodobacteraceae bacterium nBUS_24]|nr:sulfurtransferase TusA family protein [Marinovum sp.]MBT6099859.1 sulfurtransferase TusA family protein [Marinovum sp.]MBT6506462.1 sulfurtransferase TusA family protein [Marinovum sp.]MBT6531758.1 sulfurtransferase TusA family protein [Marinovum sp.]MBT7908761.1 sulfurtransferase TusA family protein [Marinovum sp.]